MYLLNLPHIKIYHNISILSLTNIYKINILALWQHIWFCKYNIGKQTKSWTQASDTKKIKIQQKTWGQRDNNKNYLRTRTIKLCQKLAWSCHVMQDSCAQIMRAVRSSGLTWGTQETPFSMFLTIRKRFLKNAKISPYNARPPTHTLGVDKGNQQYEQLLAISRESQPTIQNLESGMKRLKNDLDGEVNNSALQEMKAKLTCYIL